MQIAGQKFFNYIEILVFVKIFNMKGFIPKKSAIVFFFLLHFFYY